MRRPARHPQHCLDRYPASRLRRGGRRTSRNIRTARDRSAPYRTGRRIAAALLRHHGVVDAAVSFEPSNGPAAGRGSGGGIGRLRSCARGGDFLPLSRSPFAQSDRCRGAKEGRHGDMPEHSVLPHFATARRSLSHGKACHTARLVRSSRLPPSFGRCAPCQPGPCEGNLTAPLCAAEGVASEGEISLRPLRVRVSLALAARANRGERI